MRPLLSVEPVCEAPRLQVLRDAVRELVEGYKASGTLVTASVYVYEPRTGDWTNYGANEQYEPGSMMKIPLLLTYLSMSEEHPGMLSKKMSCAPEDCRTPYQTNTPKEQAEAGGAYTVARLLELMITHSDNHATSVLLRHVTSDRYIRTYADLGLPLPDDGKEPYKMNARDFSVFMKALYGSSLLSPINSEYALRLMAGSPYLNGIMAGLPEGINAAHKFGESGDAEGHQLHETALVYAGDHPYLITVMTRGPEAGALPGTIAELSKLVYGHMSVL